MIEPTKYQPLLFYQDNQTPCYNCGECDHWSQKMFPSDYIPFQFQVTPCFNAVNIIDNPTFSGDGSPWSPSFRASIESNGIKLLADSWAVQTLTATTGKWYEIEMDIEVFAENAPEITLYYVDGAPRFTVGTGNIKIAVKSIDNQIQVAHMQSSGELTDYIIIKSFTMREIALPSVTVRAMDNSLLDTISGAFFDGQYLNVEYSPNQNTITEGSFYLEIEQACTGFDNTWRSERVNIVAEDDCLIQVAGCSNNNLFNADFVPYMRVDAKLLADQPPIYERFLQRKTTGAWRLNYGRAAKAFTLHTDYLPEHVRDFIYLLPIFETISIKKGTNAQESYFVNTEPDAPNFKPSSDDFASITIPLVFKEDLIETIFVQDCNVILPPKMLGSTELNIAIKAGVNTAIDAS